MAKYNIYDGSTLIASGYPKYNGSYGKPAYLDLTINSPTPIPFEVGNSILYRDGRTYRLYSVPEPKKQARSGGAGDAFVYQNLQFFDQSKELENILFVDRVKNSSGYFFSSRQNLSTYENLTGIINRIQACLNEQSGENWLVMLAAGVEDDDVLCPIVEEPHEFPINGQTILDACNQVADIFKGIGWIYDYDSAEDCHYIYFGGPNVRTDNYGQSVYYGDGVTGPFLYGKGNGLISIKKYITNKDKLCTVLYAYGSERNLPLRYYNGRAICSAAAVDIPNLMIPPSEWGKSTDPDTGTLRPDAKKAFIEDNAKVSTYGRIVRRVYFNNEAEGDIYPSIKGMTIGELSDEISSGEYTDIEYHEPGAAYLDPDERVDVLKSATNPSDDGKITEAKTTETGTLFCKTTAENFYDWNGPESYLEAVQPNIDLDVLTANSYASVNTSGSYTLKAGSDSDLFAAASVRIPLFTTFAQAEAAILRKEFALKFYCGDNEIVSIPLEAVQESESSSGVRYNLKCKSNGVWWFAVAEEYGTSGITARVVGGFYGRPTQSGYEAYPCYAKGISPQSLRFVYSHTYGQRNRMNLKIKQIGFDLNDVTAINGAKGTLNFLDGNCGGRAFTIRKCTYNSATDDYTLLIDRVQDKDTGMLYPNATFPLVAGDKFVLTEIYMPDLYVAVAEGKLLAAATSYYNMRSAPKFLYTPEVDSSKIADGTFPLPKPGMYMSLEDEEITGGVTEYILIDSVTISEGESSIPVLSVTLRERLNVPQAE